VSVTLEELAARVEELAREKAKADQKVATLEEEIRALRAAPEESRSARGTQGAVRRTLRRPMTRLGLLAAAGAAGASAVLPAGAQAETHPASLRPHVALISPNGLFQLDVINSGIYLKGPAGGIELTNNQIKIASNVAVSILGTGTVTVNAGQVKLNNGSNPVARLGDTVVNGSIVSGNQTVLA
jgi:hypothetical protein